MKKKYLLMLAIIPILFIAASSPFENQLALMDGDDQLSCSEYGEENLDWDGNSGCAYEYDFNAYIVGGCTLVDIDLDKNTAGIQHYLNAPTAELWTDGYDGIIRMLPKPAYAYPGFVKSCNIYVHFSDNTFESTLWTCIVDQYPGPYPPKCY